MGNWVAPRGFGATMVVHQSTSATAWRGGALMQAMLRTACICVVLGLGCGRVQPTPFSEATGFLADQMKVAVQKKSTADIDGVVQRAEKHRLIREQEMRVLKAVQQYSRENKWKEADELIGESTKGGGAAPK